MIDTASGNVEGRDLSRQPLRRRMLRHLEDSEIFEAAIAGCARPAEMA
jgi:hypothetical protein